jgi:deoxyribose-phosphate aldolase
LANEINAILPIVKNKGKVIKIIIDSGILTDDEIIIVAICMELLVLTLLKTSTGYAEKGASVVSSTINT